MDRLRSFLRLIALSPIAMLGAILATLAFVAYFVMVFAELFLLHGNPYWGIVINMVFPAIAVIGLILVAIGLFLRVRAEGAGFSLPALATLAERRRIRRTYAWQIVVALSVINVAILGLFSFRGYHFTESRQFCGELCHEVMEPEHTVYGTSPHSEISCTACHIGEGATWFVKSKLSGLRQVYAVLTNSYSRPIETPVANLRPAREVCEVCHRPEIFHGDRILVIEKYAPDRENTRTYSVLNMRVGSGGEKVAAHGIHWHVSREHNIRYYPSDEKREKIDWLDRIGADGERRAWTRPGSGISESDIEPEEIRTMDCIDCHNRPTHIYPPPERVIDDLLSRGLVDVEIPWIRKYAEEVITRDYATREEAMEGIAELTGIYAEREPGAWAEYQAQIEEAVAHLRAAYRLYVYPSMGVRWNTYPSLIGHPTQETSACFRCHDGLLQDAEGEIVTTECDACHYVLARDERDPVILKILAGQ